VAHHPPEPTARSILLLATMGNQQPFPWHGSFWLRLFVSNAAQVRGGRAEKYIEKS